MTHAVDFRRFTHLTFDCYGTMIDWESGLLQALRPVLSVHGVRVDDRDVLERFAAIEPVVQAGPYQPYRDVLREVMRRLGEGFGLSLEGRELDRLPESIARWPAFADTAAALAALARRFGLVVVSNIDEDLFELTRPKLEAAGGWAFERIVTAELCRSYKPHPRHWRVALALLDAEPGRVLHVAQSLFHDIRPARDLGLATVWVDRRRGKPGAGATPPASANADLTVPDLATLARLATGE